MHQHNQYVDVNRFYFYSLHFKWMLLMSEIKLEVENLQLGNFIRLPLSWNQHPFLLTSFKIQNIEQIEIIRRLGLKFVYLNIEKSEFGVEIKNEDNKVHIKNNSFEDKMNEKRKNIEKLNYYKRCQKNSEKNFIYSLNKIKDVIAKVESSPRQAVIDAYDLIGFISDMLVNGNNVSIHLMPDSRVDQSLYYHSLNVATLSMILAKKCNKSIEDINTLGVSALFHDIGNKNIPSQILRKKEPLSVAELNLYKMHPIYSVKNIESAKEISKQTKDIILKHHERLDGSGYPNGIKEIDELTQVLSLVDEFDYVCNPVLASKKIVSPYNALSYLFKHCGNKLNKRLISILIKQIGIYPPGTVVEFTTGQIGLVMSINENRLHSPKVMIYDPAVPKEEAALIDLEYEQLQINKALLPSLLSADIVEYLQPRNCVCYFIDNLE